MSQVSPISLLLSLLVSTATSLTTCPGFPGYCSESFPGNSCNVVCDVGRNNVPLCQEDGTWTDIPRCIEHAPGVEEQIPGLCPAIPGYCAQGFINTNCKFDCLTGADIDSLCTTDGTWAPYPTCEGDLRETRDGCDGCPGPQGAARNRTAEAAILSNTISDRRLPKIIGDNGGRKRIPSFEGNINIGLLNPEEETVKQDRFFQGRPTPRATSPSTQAPPAVTSDTRQLISTIVNRQQQSGASQPLTLFDRIKNRINKGKKQEAQQPQTKQQLPPKQQPQPKQQPKFRRPQQPPPQTFEQSQASSTFGVFEQVNLQPQRPRTSQRAGQQSTGFFGVFPEVNLEKFR